MSPLRGEFNIFTAYSCLKQTADIIEWFSNVVIITLSLVNFICAPFDASFEIDTRFKHKLGVCRTSLKIIFYLYHMQVHLSGNNIPMVKPPPNHISPPSMAATFLAIRLRAVLQLSGYSVFHGRDTLIQLGLLWRSYSCQCLNTETSTWGNRSITTETPSISYTISLYKRLVVIL